MKYINFYTSPLGKMMMASDGEALTGLWFDGQKYFPTLSADCEIVNLPVFTDTKRWLDEYFAGRIPNFTPKLKLTGTAFRKHVWQMLRRIPYGRLTTYKTLANMLAEASGQPSMSAQAVGGAVGHNPIVLIIPCHRVVGSDGNMTGYAAGTDKKQALLALEGSAWPASNISDF